MSYQKALKEKCVLEPERRSLECVFAQETKGRKCFWTQWTVVLSGVEATMIAEEQKPLKKTADNKKLSTHKCSGGFSNSVVAVKKQID